MCWPFETGMVHDKKQVGSVTGKDESKELSSLLSSLTINQLKLVNLFGESTVC